MLLIKLFVKSEIDMHMQDERGKHTKLKNMYVSVIFSHFLYLLNIIVSLIFHSKCYNSRICRVIRWSSYQYFIFSWVAYSYCYRISKLIYPNRYPPLLTISSSIPFSPTLPCPCLLSSFTFILPIDFQLVETQTISQSLITLTTNYLSKHHISSCRSSSQNQVQTPQQWI